jgi:hypothetical protein
MRRSDTLAAGYTAALGLRSATRVLQLLQETQLDPSQPAGQTVRSRAVHTLCCVARTQGGSAGAHAPLVPQPGAPVLAPCARTRAATRAAHGRTQVYDATRAAEEWGRLLPPRQTLSVHCLHLWSNSNVTNSQLVQRRVRDAVCDAVRDARGARPAPPEGPAQLPLVFQMLSDNLQLFRDLGGGSLHRRVVSSRVGCCVGCACCACCLCCCCACCLCCCGARC